MGILDSVERSLEKAVRGAFSRGSKSQVQPVEIASRIRREMDDKSMTLSAGRTISPNVMDIKLSEADFERAKSWGTALAEELCDVVINHARSQGYSLQGPVRVSFTQDSELRPGDFNVLSTTEKSPGSQAQHAAPERPNQAPRQPRAAAPTSSVGYAPPAQPSRPAPSVVLSQPVLDIAGQRYSLNAESITLGRSAEADILIDDTGVSRKHLEILSSANSATAVDLGSTNGVYVNGRRITGSLALRDGDSLKIGRTTMVFRLIPAPAGNATTSDRR